MKDFLELICEVAQNNELIRGAYLEGSRANPEIAKDIFQDYDVVYIVNETKPFIEDEHFIDIFGPRLYMQCPEDENIDQSWGWLIQLADGNRLDLHVKTPEAAKNSLELYKVLVDKDNLIENKENHDSKIYYIKHPNQIEFSKTANEFWWCLNNVAKGLWRKEVLYALDMVNHIVRPMLTKMLFWKAAADHDFNISVGKSGKHLNKYLSLFLYEKYLETFSIAKIENIWASTFTMCELFNEVALDLSSKLNLKYNIQEANNSLYFLSLVYDLPENAKSVIEKK